MIELQSAAFTREILDLNDSRSLIFHLFQPIPTRLLLITSLVQLDHCNYTSADMCPQPP